MCETYTFRWRMRKLLQWHCKPSLWNLRTPVHMFALDTFLEVYPNAKSLWGHRDLTKVLGSVCSFIAYVRSWSSDRNDLKTDPVNTAARSYAQLGLTSSDAA